ncbi:MAG: methionyl-tRNA formyltransferase [Patescibacteria group bacterium]
MINQLKIVFVGTPEFAVPYLDSLLDDERFKVMGVITQPDKPVGRKQELIPTPIKQLAEKKGLKIWQSENVKKDETLVRELKLLDLDLLVVVAFGQIIPQTILAIARYGNINVHPSLLPKYRGASPIQSAILAGEKKTGLSIMLMDEKMDHGPILSQQEVLLTGEETNESLHRRLAEIGKEILKETIIKFVAGEIKPQEQNHDETSFCATISKDDARIDWAKSAREIKRKIHAFYSWPATWTTWNDKRLKIFPPVEIDEQNIASGSVVCNDGRLIIGCGEKSLIIKKLQLEGKKEMSGEDFLRGYKEIAGAKLT